MTHLKGQRYVKITFCHAAENTVLHRGMLIAKFIYFLFMNTLGCTVQKSIFVRSGWFLSDQYTTIIIQSYEVTVAMTHTSLKSALSIYIIIS